MRNQNRHTGSSFRLHDIMTTPELLIDLFVEMNFDSKLNQNIISQFKLVALQLGFSPPMIEQVVTIGINEYSQIMK